MATEKPLYLSDLLTGLFAALAMRELQVLSLRDSRFDRALARLADDVAAEATKEHLSLRFRLRTHPVHRDSTQIQHALWEAAQRELVSLDNPEFQDVRLKITPADAPRYFAKLPGSEMMYRKLADKLMTYYRENATA
jgi:hypothetical protein